MAGSLIGVRQRGCSMLRGRPTSPSTGLRSPGTLHVSGLCSGGFVSCLGCVPDASVSAPPACSRSGRGRVLRSACSNVGVDRSWPATERSPRLQQRCEGEIHARADRRAPHGFGAVTYGTLADDPATGLQVAFRARKGILARGPASIDPRVGRPPGNDATAAPACTPPTRPGTRRRSPR